MPLRKADGPLTVQLPSADDDRTSWMGVAAIGLLGFVVGVTWPRLTGLRLGPSVPQATQVTPSDSASLAGAPTPSAPPAIAAALAPAVASSKGVAASATAGPRVEVARGAIVSCKTASGDVLKSGDCDALPGLDAVVVPRLRKLSDCAEAASTNGSLRYIVRADFPRNALAIDLGRDRNLATAEPLLVCAKGALASASLQGIKHEEARYSAAYVVTFGGTPADAAEPAPSANSVPNGTDGKSIVGESAQVEWDVALVRDTPKTGRIVARLPRGTALRVGPSKDGWYPVKYGAGFAGDGWVYRSAIGR